MASHRPPPMYGLLAAGTLLLAPSFQEGRVLSICFDDVSHEFLGNARAAGIVPSLERLARQGRVYGHFYAAPNCSPSRARYLLGRYHTGVGNNFKLNNPIQWSMNPRGAFPASLPGTKVHVGKWHLAALGDLTHPLQCGFDSWAGPFRNVDDYYEWGRSSPFGVRRSFEYVTEWTARTTRELLPASDFISVALNAAHKPYHAPPGHLHTFGDLAGASDETLAMAMLQAADTVIGPVVFAALDEGFTVFLWSDNGGPTFGTKGKLGESAINTWLIVVGDGVRPGESELPVDQVDLAATFSELMGGRFASHDSRSFVYDLHGTAPPPDPRTWTYTEAYDTDRLPPAHERRRAIRDERWKLVLRPDKPPSLFDLVADPGEEQNLWPSNDPTARSAFRRLLASMP